jgi:mannose-6-phosphate isomerase-like protein (cupin superfamily)
MDPSAVSATHLWFLDTLVTIHISCDEGTGTTSLIEHRARQADSPPLHVHRAEDELFYVLDGEMRFRIAQGERRIGPGHTVLVPKGVPHTYRVESAAGARWLTVTTGGDFERFVRALARPAGELSVPPPAGEPTPDAIQHLTDTARLHGIEIVGPPLH